jgi:hypothetical protein
MMFSWWKWRSSLISRRVRRQNIEWSNGVIRFMATLRDVGTCVAEHTTPYAPSPITSPALYDDPTTNESMKNKK